jgi:hypothetical protein
VQLLGESSKKLEQPRKKLDASSYLLGVKLFARCERKLLGAQGKSPMGRAEAGPHTKTLIDALSQASPEFETVWLVQDVSTHSEGTKHIQHPTPGPSTLEYSALVVDGKPHLGVVI